MSGLNPTQRFSSRVENYVRFRPGYPLAVIDILREECELDSDWIVADIGSGTGLLSDVFIGNGNRVLGVEPNREMRQAAEIELQDSPEFTQIKGTAEETTLNSHSVDLVAAGQAFHWFDLEKTRAEFRRILKPGRHATLIWNERRIDDDPLQREYENLLLQFGIDYQQLSFRHRVDETTIDRFFLGGWTNRKVENSQLFGEVAFKGRLMSASYTPEPGAPNFEPMIEELSAIFARHQTDGIVQMNYWTTIYTGQV